jgi:hypothetical protein
MQLAISTVMRRKRRVTLTPILAIMLLGLMAIPAVAQESAGKASGEITYDAFGLLRGADCSVREALRPTSDRRILLLGCSFEMAQG